MTSGLICGAVKVGWLFITDSLRSEWNYCCRLGFWQKLETAEQSPFNQSSKGFSPSVEGQPRTRTTQPTTQSTKLQMASQLAQMASAYSMPLAVDGCIVSVDALAADAEASRSDGGSRRKRWCLMGCSIPRTEFI